MNTFAPPHTTDRSADFVADLPTRKGPLGRLLLVARAMTVTRNELRRALRL